MDEEERTQAEILADIIKSNKGCRAFIDNDNWHIIKALPEGFEDWNDEYEDDWYENEALIASNHQFPDLGISYGYGILEALATLVGMTLELP